MNFFLKLSGLFRPAPLAKKAARPPAKRNPRIKHTAGKSSMILEKSFLQRKFAKPEVETSTYTDSEWIFAAIQILANTVGKIPIRLFRGERNGRKTEIADHRILQVLKKPNPHQTQNDLRVFTQMNLELFGRAYWYLARGGWTGIPKEIWPLTSSEVSPRTNPDGDLIGYVVSRWGYRVNIPVEEMIAFRQISPNSIHEGESAAKAAARSVQADVNTLRYVEAFFANSARPDFILSVLGISPDDAAKLEMRWKNKHGGVAKSNKPAIIDGAIKLEKLTAALKDLDITEQSRERRDRIFAAFGVPKAVLGMVDDVNRASMEGSKLAFAEFAVDPRLQEFVEKLTAFFLPKFPNSDNLFFEADEHIPRDNELAIREIDSGLSSGYLTINEARAKRKLDPIKNGDEILISFGRVPLSQVLAAPAKLAPEKQKSAPSEKSQSREELIRKADRIHARNEKKFIAIIEDLFARQKREVIAGLKKGFKKDALNPIDEQKWVREFIDTTVPLYLLMIEDGGGLGAAAVGALTGRAVEFSPRIPAVVNETSRMATEFARFVNDTTKQNLRVSLMEGLNLGESEATMADRVDEVFRIRKNNAMTIARTETTRSINFGQIEGYRQNGIKTKEWAAGIDGDTRDAHRAADGQKRGLDDPFLVGGEYLQTPGDPSGSPENTINCRCQVLPVP